MRFKDIILFTLTFLLMGCDGSYQSNKDEMVTELKTYDKDTSSCPSSGCMFVAVGDSGTIFTSSDGTHGLQALLGLQKLFMELPMEIAPLKW